MSQITVYYQFASGNWNDANAWNTEAGGGGTAYTNPQNGTDTFICNLNGKAVTLNVDVILDRILAAAGTLTASGTRFVSVGSVNGIVYSGTSTAGMIILGSGASLTVSGQAVNNGSGYLFVGSGTATAQLGTVVNNGTGRAVSWTGGNISAAKLTANSIGSMAFYLNNAASTLTVTEMDGAGGINIYNAAGAAVFTGEKTLAENQCIFIRSTTSNATINLANLTLSLEAGAAFVLEHWAGTVTTTNASIIRKAASSQVGLLGRSVATTYNITISGPTLPDAANVATGSGQFGYAGSLLTPSYPTTETSQAAQLATDAAEVDAVKEYITTDVEDLLGVAGTLDMSLYTLTSGMVWPAVENVEVAETAWGPTGAEYAGELDLAAAEAAAYASGEAAAAAAVAAAADVARYSWLQRRE